ncbi:MAG: glycosyltransferase [Chloroflexota bacterium]
MAPRVSILVATWNRARFLPDALDSVLRQTMPDFEVIVSDNASTDDTEALVRGYAERDSRVRYFRNDENVGITRNFNLCYARSSDTPYWVALPSDDRWDPTYLERALAVMEAEPDVALVHTDAFRTDANGSVINRWSDLWSAMPPPGRHQALKELMRGCYICFPTAFARRSMLENVYPRPAGELFDTAFSHTLDWNFYLNLLGRGAQLYYLDTPLAYFRKHDGAMTMPAHMVPRLREEIRVLDQSFAAVCPPELDHERRLALQERAANLGFNLLGSDAADEAGVALETARQAGHRRLDVMVAGAISSLPVSPTVRGRLWRVTYNTSTVVRGLRPPTSRTPVTAG